MTTTKSYITLKEKYDRVIVLIDMDCFYCQVEELLDEKLKGRPIAVVQYTENAGIIAVNYAARALGVTRHMREKEAKTACPDLVCVKVPSKFNKADISKYREAGKRVANVFEKFTNMLERASIDEAYMDITENVAERVQKMRNNKFTLAAEHLHNTYIVGYDNIGKFIQEVSQAVDSGEKTDNDPERKSFESSKLRLLIGASIVSDIRKAVKQETGYECSAGIAHNKILAKLVCCMNKPNKQTVLPIESVPKLFQNLEISKIKSMGGKIGEEVCKKLDVKFMADLLPFEESDLQQNFGPRIGTFLYLIAKGIDLEKVERKVMSKSIAVSKNFRGKNEIINVNTLKYWLKELSKELKERLDKDQEETNRLAKQMIVQYTQVINKKDVASSRTVQLNGKAVNGFTSDEIGEEAFKTLERNTAQLLKAEGTTILNNNVKHLGISAGKLEDASAVSSKSIDDFLRNPATIKKSPKVEKINENPVNVGENHSKLEKVRSNEDVRKPAGSDGFLSEFEYNPSKVMLSAEKSGLSRPKMSKSDTKIGKNNENDNLESKFRPKISKNPNNFSFTPKISTNTDNSGQRLNSEHSSSKSSLKSTDSLTTKSSPPKMSIFPLKNQITFTQHNLIRGENTLKHWISQLLTEIDRKVTKSRQIPSKLQLKWKQQQNGKFNSFSNEILLSDFSNGISSDVFVNLIKDPTNHLVIGSDFDPISFIEIEVMEFTERSCGFWMLNVENAQEQLENDESEGEQMEFNEEEIGNDEFEVEKSENREFRDEHVEFRDEQLNIDDELSESDKNRPQNKKFEDGQLKTRKVYEDNLQNSKSHENNLKNPDFHVHNLQNDENLVQSNKLFDESQYPSSYTPTDDFYDENLSPDKLLDVELKVDDDELEILKLERSFLGLSPLKPKVPDNNSNKPETTNKPGPSYQNNYVELQKPANVSVMFDVLNPLEECLECGKMIRKLDMITHIDGHIAMKISNMQREEYRAEQKQKLLQKAGEKSARKTQKSKAVMASKKAVMASQKVVNLIDKFTKKDSLNDSNWDNSILCEQCNQLIEVDSFQTHQDYHYAQKLRMEQMLVRKKCNSTTKKKRPNVSQPKCEKDPKMVKSLKEYFKE